ncbi:hypothetical protein B0H13DRAFT_1907041 [Mycena leptocephala]|nr:hypothetical protein B0H13DRAFT_1907041 [Mycena leptocephala]
MYKVNVIAPATHCARRSEVASLCSELWPTRAPLVEFAWAGANPRASTHRGPPSRARSIDSRSRPCTLRASADIRRATGGRRCLASRSSTRRYQQGPPNLAANSARRRRRKKTKQDKDSLSEERTLTDTAATAAMHVVNAAVTTYLGLNLIQDILNAGRFNLAGRGYPDVGAQGENIVIVYSHNPSCGTDFTATAGWDPITCLGTPKFPKLSAILRN